MKKDIWLKVYKTITEILYGYSGEPSLLYRMKKTHKRPCHDPCIIHESESQVPCLNSRLERKYIFPLLLLLLPSKGWSFLTLLSVYSITHTFLYYPFMCYSAHTHIHTHIEIPRISERWLIESDSTHSEWKDFQYSREGFHSSSQSMKNTVI